MTAKNEVRFSELSTYQGRKRSFPNNWYSIHPQETLSPHVMAKAGFYYIRGDLVKCYYCEKELENWEEDDNVYKEHRDHANYCPFVKMFPTNAPDKITFSQALILERERIFFILDRDFAKWESELRLVVREGINEAIKEGEKASKPRKYKKVKK
ncbi:hypothetical protein O3M35_005686 [Rhynocoris fuscipes]|uniref:Uncharacterized protein n=1 Tax=Rhynocoris fuscipes TaxID=488301 RepID=A0AAW1DL34_9HEMI